MADKIKACFTKARKKLFVLLSISISCTCTHFDYCTTAVLCYIYLTALNEFADSTFINL